MTDQPKPWVKWYSTDWRADPPLRMCSYAARGMWADLLSLMMEAEPFGYLLVKGRAPTTAQLAGLLGGGERMVAKLIEELHEARVCSRIGDTDMADDVAGLIDPTIPAGTILCRRMLRDKAKEMRDRANGRTGGNPKLKRRDNPDVEPPPTTGGLTTPDKAHMPEARYQKPESNPPTPQGGREFVDTVDDEFERWYAAYPLHKGRGQALRAYRTARKKASAEVLIAGAQRYAADENRKPGFTKHPATWLNGECWADDAAPPTDPFEPPAFLDRRQKPNGAQPPGAYLGRATPLPDGHAAISEHRHLTAWLDPRTPRLWSQLWNGTWKNADEPRDEAEARARLAELEPVIWPDETRPQSGGPKAPAAEEA